MEAYKTKSFDKPEELVEFLNTNPSVSVVAITDNSEYNIQLYFREEHYIER